MNTHLDRKTVLNGTTSTSAASSNTTATTLPAATAITDTSKPALASNAAITATATATATSSPSATTSATTTTAASTATSSPATATNSKPDLSASGLSQYDPQLRENKAWQLLHAKLSVPASDAAVAAAAAAMQAKGIKAVVVNDAKAAVDAVAKLIPSKASVGFGYSTTFNEIGLIDYFKDRKDLHNFREIALAADAKGDRAAGFAARMQGQSADWYLTSANAVSVESGDIILADGTGTRVPGVMTAKHTILVIAANKLVATNAEAMDRLHKYVLPVESARLREVYKLPGSAINNLLVVRGPNPYNPGSLHVILIAGHSYGF